MSENGWTNDFLCEQWFRDIFIPQTKNHNIECGTLNAPILLIYDSHGSHLTDKMLCLTQENNIELFQLPAHTTHCMQPLDVSVFGPLQWCWMERCDDILESTRQEIHTVDFIKEYMEVHQLALTEDTIKMAWQKCRICPINHNVFTEEDFATSHSSSTKSHAPISYPGFLQGENSGDKDGADGVDELLDFADCDWDEDDSSSDNSDDSDAPIILPELTIHSQPPSHWPLIFPHPSLTCSQCPPLQPKAVPSHHGWQIIRQVAQTESKLMKLRSWEDLLAYVTQLENELKNECDLVDLVMFHADMMQEENAELQNKLNSKWKRKDQNDLTMDVGDVCWLTGLRGQGFVQAVWEGRAAKKQKKDDADVKKADAVNQRQARWLAFTNGEVLFSGNVALKKVDELKDICWALAASEEGTKDTPIATIKTCLADPAIQNSLKFSGLYFGRRPTATDENAPPPPPHSPPPTRHPDPPLASIPSSRPALSWTNIFHFLLIYYHKRT